MNKLTFSLLLVGLFAVAALARTSPSNRSQFKFTPGQTYIYEYRGRQWNGITKLADQYAGLTLDCDVILQALPEQSGREVVMKLDDIKIEQLHTQSLDSNDIRKLNQGQEQNQRQMTMYKEELSKPIRFTYVDGKIVRFVAESTDAEWSINIKKSVLSLFQLDLAPTKIIKSPRTIEQTATGFYSQPEDILRTSTETPLVYPIYEESFGGICETLYEVDSIDNVEGRQQQTTVEFNDVLNVTKTVNYKNCLTDPSVSYDRHSFDVNTQTIKGQLFSQQSTVLNQNYRQVPEELKAKYSGANSFAQKDNVASPVPVERHSYTKYNITTAPLSLVERRTVPVSSPSEMNIIEGIYSEGKIKYESNGDLLVSDTQQSLTLITCVPTIELARYAPEISSTILRTQMRQPTVSYETIQCELSAQKLKFYQAIAKFAQVKDSVRGRQMSPSSALYSHKLALPFALSASWYPIVATGQESAEHSIERTLEPEQLAKSYEHLLTSLAEDVISEDVAASKRAGEKIVRIVNIVAFLPKYKLAEIYERITSSLAYLKTNKFNADTTINKDITKTEIKRKLYLDSLPLAGSKQAIEMIEELIVNKHVKSWEAKEMCEAVPANLRYPDTEIIDAFIRISQLPQVRSNRNLFASCSIAVGKMIGSAYAKSKDASYKPTTYDSVDQLPSQLRADEIVSQVVEEADPRRQLPMNWNSPDQKELYDRLVLDEQDLIKYFELYKQMLNQATQFHAKVIYIETLAHMKVPHVLPILEPFATGRLSLDQCLGNKPLDIERPIEQSQWYNYYARQQRQQGANSQKDWTQEDSYNAEECNYMRTIAIYALAHVVHTAPAKVQAMLLPVFDNTYEPYQIRIAAFTTMMLSPVDEHILERVASQMWREPSKEVASFVVGFIDTMSKLTAPKMAAYKRAALKAADSMPKQYLDTWKFSWAAGGDHYNSQKQSGYVWLAEMIKSNVSAIPRAGYANLGRLNGNKYDNQFQIGFTTKGLESLLKEYIAYSQSQEADSTNLMASIFETMFDAKDDLVKTYREARDSVKQSILMPGEQNRAFTENQYYFKRQQPIEGVNTNTESSTSKLFESQRPKRSITIQTRSSTDDDEEAKLTIFSKIFDSTSYHALDKKQIIQMLEKSDDYLKMAADVLIAGGRLHYVKMMMPSNMWHMVPSQLGLPVVVTHRSPIVASIKIDGTQNGQLTSNIVSQYMREQATQGQVPNTKGFNFATVNGLNITALVHPKIMHSNFHFMFAVEQANCEAYGVQTEKSHQLSVPMEVSIAYSQPRELFSLAIQPKTPVRMVWAKEAAKTFIGQVALATAQADNWLGQEHLVRIPSEQAEYKRLQRQESFVPSVLASVQNLINSPKEQQINSIEELETPYKFEHRFVQQLMGLELYLEGVSDDEDVVRAMSKPELRPESRGNMQWNSAKYQKEQAEHTSSGPLGEYLHLLDSAVNRPSKYLEFYSTLKPVQANKPPVYRMDFILNGKQQQHQKQQQQQSMIGRRPVIASRLAGNQNTWNTIEQTKMNKIAQMQPQQIMMEVY